MDIKVYRFINSHAMTQIIFLSKTFCNDFIKYIISVPLKWDELNN